MKRYFFLLLLLLINVAARGADDSYTDEYGIVYKRVKATNNIYGSDLYYYTVESLNRYSRSTSISIKSYINNYYVRTISNAAFSDNTYLRHVTIPSSIMAIGKDAFKGTNLETLTLKGEPSSIGTNAFGEIERVDVPNIELWGKICNASTGSNSVWLSINGQPLDKLTIPETYTDIPAFAYYRLKFKTVIIGSNVKTMGLDCFSSGSILKTIWLPNVVPSGYPACAKGSINYCSSSAYTESLFNPEATDLVTYPTLSSRFTVNGVVYALDGQTADAIDCEYDVAPAPLTIGPNVTYRGRTFPVRHIRPYACYDTDSIVGDLTIANQGYIGNYAFYDCDSIRTLTVGNQGNIGTSAFEKSGVTTKATINNAGYIGYRAFTNITGTFAAEVNNQGYIGDQAFYGDKLTTLEVGSNVTDIGSSAFECSTISESAAISNRDYIGNRAFYQVIGGYSANINNAGSIGSYAFSYSSMSTLTIHNSVKNIGAYAFSCDTISTKASINHSGTTGKYVFYGCTGGFDADIQCSGILPEHCFYKSRMGAVTIGNNITTIEKNCFENSYFTTATIGSSVASIKERGFAEATGFTQMVLPDNVQTMDEQAFKKCTTMQDITLSRGLTLIKEGTFSGCSALSGIFLPQQIDSIGHNVFDDCTVMRTVTFEDKEGDYKLGYSTEKKSPLFFTAGLDSVYVGGRLKYDAKEKAYYSPFRAHPSLRALRFTDNEVRIYDREFENCKALKNIYMGAGIDGIGEYAFSGCTRLGRVKVGTGVQPLGRYSFAGCTNLETIDLSNVVTIHNNSFDGCSALSMIRLPHTTTSVGNQTFLQCTALKDLIIEDRTDTLSLGFNYNDTSYKGITGAGTPLFSDCQLDSVYIGGPIKYSKTKKDGYSPFYYNESLRTVFVNNNEKQVYENEFFNCLNMTTIRLGEGVERIEPFGFQSCTGLLYFTFGSTLQSIGANGFSDCTNVAVITSHATTPPVCGEQALADINFWDCKLYVPAESLDAYAAADQWKMFFAEPLDEPEPSIPGDINGDSDVDVADIVAEIDKVLEGSTDAAYDMNSDGAVDVADIVAVIDYVLSYVGTSQPNNAPARRAKNDNLTTASGILSAQAEAEGIRLSLDSEQTYTAFQFVLTLPDGASLTDVVPDADRMDGHTLRFYRLSDNSFFILGYASDNHEFYGTQGTLLHMMADVSEDGTASISDVRFATANGESHRLQGLAIDLTAYGTATGISEVKSERVKEEKVFDISGRRMDARRTLPAGIYLFNGKKIVIK